MQNQTELTPDKPKKGMAIASLVLGIVGIPTLGLCFIGGIAGLILGVIAMTRAGKNPAKYAGKGLAIAGIVLSSLSLLIAIPGTIAALAIPNLLKSQQAAREAAAIREIRTICQAEVLYSTTKGQGEYANLRVLGAEGLIDPTLASGQKGGYLFTAEPVSSISGTPMFDTTARPLETGTFGTGNRPFASNETFIFYKADGSVEIRGTPGNRIPAGAVPFD